MSPWNSNQQREWILKRLEEDISNLAAIRSHTHNFPSREGQVRREEAISVLITVADQFGLMPPDALLEWLNQQANSELLRDVPAYNRLAARFGD